MTREQQRIRGRHTVERRGAVLFNHLQHGMRERDMVLQDHRLQVGIAYVHVCVMDDVDFSDWHGGEQEQQRIIVGSVDSVGIDIGFVTISEI